MLIRILCRIFNNLFFVVLLYVFRPTISSSPASKTPTSSSMAA